MVGGSFAAVERSMSDRLQGIANVRRQQRDGFPDPHSSVTRCKLDERLHISPRIAAPVSPPCRLFPLRLCRKAFPCPLAIGGCRFPSHPNGRSISNRRRRLIVPCRRWLMFFRFQKLLIEAEGDFIAVNGVGIKRHGVFRPFVWEAVVTPHGEWTGRDENHRSAIPPSTSLDRQNRLPVIRGLWLCRPKTHYPCHEADP